MRIILAGVAIAAGVASVSPLADFLDTPVVGGAVPTRFQDLVGYLTIKPGASIAGQTGPFQADTPDQVNHLRELTALSFGGGIAVAALVYAILSRVLK